MKSNQKHDKILTPNRPLAFKNFVKKSSVTTYRKYYVDSSKHLSASMTSSNRSRELKIATLRREEIEQQNEAKFCFKQQNFCYNWESWPKKIELNWSKLPIMKEKSVCET